MNKYLYSLLLIISLALFSACSNDDDDTNVSLESYILGRWHSTSFIANAGQKSAAGNISKNGTYSELYYEIVFLKKEHLQFLIGNKMRIIQVHGLLK